MQNCEKIVYKEQPSIILKIMKKILILLFLLINYSIFPKIIDKLLLYASANGNLKLVTKLIQKGADIESKNFLGATPLIHAVCNNDYNISYFLIEKGANVNAESYYSFSVLHYALFNEAEFKIIELLIKNNANYNIIMDDAWLLFHWACYNGYKELVKLLLTLDDLNIDQFFKNDVVYFSEINKSLDLNCTPLMLSCIYGQEEIVKILLKNGADKNLKDEYGKDALSYAYEFNQQAIVKLLIK